jgi:prophage regulatory protein
MLRPCPRLTAWVSTGETQMVERENPPRTDRRPLRMLRLPEVQRKTGLGRSRIYDMESKGLFPKRVKLSERTTAWVEQEVDDFLRKCMDARHK